MLKGYKETRKGIIEFSEEDKAILRRLKTKYVKKNKMAQKWVIL